MSKTLEEIGPVLSIENAALRISISPWTLRKWVGAKKISYTKIGHRIGIPLSEIERVLRENLRAAR